MKTSQLPPLNLMYESSRAADIERWLETLLHRKSATCLDKVEGEACSVRYVAATDIAGKTGTHRPVGAKELAESLVRMLDENDIGMPRRTDPRSVKGWAIYSCLDGRSAAVLKAVWVIPFPPGINAPLPESAGMQPGM